MGKLAVLYDSQIFSFRSYGGISRYFFELIKGYNNSDRVHASVAISHSRNLYLTNEGYSTCFTDFNPARSALIQMMERAGGVRGSRIVRHGTARLDRNVEAQSKALAEGHFDVFHPTYYDPYFLKHLNGKKFALTIHDMIHEIFPQKFSKNDSTAARKKTLANNADIIIAVSESTKRDIIRILEIPAEKIHVVYHASSLRQEVTSLPSASNRGKYLLFVGQRREYKNFDFMLEALAGAFRDSPDLNLVCIGGGPFTDKERLLMESNGYGGRVVQRSVGDSELADLYNGAAAFICPSEYEGFGIPALEAMSCGCPVVLSNSSSLPEVGGTAAEYFDPHDQKELRDKIESILDNESLSMKMRNEGLIQASRFSWKKTLDRTETAYRSLT